jgi:hypothetical protein
VAAGHVGCDVPVTAHPACPGRRQVTHHRAQARQVEWLVVQRQDGPLQLEGHMTLFGEFGRQPGLGREAGLGAVFRRNREAGHRGGRVRRNRSPRWAV